MRRRTLVTVIVFFLLGVHTWADIELGVGVSPPLRQTPADMPADMAGPLGNVMISFHAGYSFWWLFYASADAYVLPPFVVQQMTEYTDSQGFVKDGQFRPGFLSLFNVGIRPKIGPFAVSASIGMNTLYMYKQSELPSETYKPSLGVNLRLGAYFFLNSSMAILASGTTVFPDSGTMITTIKNVFGENEFLKKQAADYIVGNLYPTISFILNF